MLVKVTNDIWVFLAIQLNSVCYTDFNNGPDHEAENLMYVSNEQHSSDSVNEV